MPKVSVSVPHSHDPEEVMNRAKPYLEKLIDDFEGEDLQVDLGDRQGTFTFRSMMFNIQGDLIVDEEKISVSIDLPLAAMLFKDKVEKGITKLLTRAVSEAE